MVKNVTELKGRVASEKKSKSASTAPCSESLKRDIVSFAERALSRSESVSSVSRKLGVSVNALHRWLGYSMPEEEAPGFVEVSLKGEGVFVDRSYIVLEMPGSAVVRGLRVSDIVEILRGLR